MTFVKGQSGNPAGRPPGARNRRSLIAEGLLDADTETITAKAIVLAKAGEQASLRLCMDRILPRMKSTPVPFALPPVVNEDDVPAAVTAILAAMGSGELAPAEGIEFLRAVEIAARCLTSVMSKETVNELAAYFGRLRAQWRGGARAANTSTDQAEQAARSGAGNGQAGPANTSAKQAEQAPRQSTTAVGAKPNGAAAHQPARPPANTSAEQAQQRCALEMPPGWMPGDPPDRLGAAMPAARGRLLRESVSTTALQRAAADRI